MKRVFIVKLTSSEHDEDLEQLTEIELRDLIAENLPPVEINSDFCQFGVEVFEL